MTQVGPPGRPYGLGQEARKISQVAAAAAGEVKPVPEIGGTSFAASLKEIIGGLRKQMAEVKEETASAVKEFQDQVTAARQIPQRIKAETQTLRDGINELLGNQPPSGS